MYQVLYRKWRPKTFSDVIGQDDITTTLKNELLTGRISHAYLFTGSRGTGKTTCAKILAKAINCLNPSNGDPCLSCENCLGIDNGSITDIIEIDAASNNGVENIRNLREESFYAPAVAKYRVYIIDEVHMLSIGAFNALLKTLEEPCDHVVFILATTEVQKIPATILSRCQRFDFNRISVNAIAKRLLFVAQNENISLDYNAATLISKLSDGALRDALSILDQCIVKSSCEKHSSNMISMDTVSSVVGLAGKEHIYSISDSILNNDTSSILCIINDLYIASKSMTKLCEELLEHFRSMMICKTINNPSDLSVVIQDYDSSIETQSEKASLNQIMYIMELLQSCLQKMQRSLNSRVELELTLIKACNPNLNDNNNSLLSRIAKLESQSLTTDAYNKEKINNSNHNESSTNTNINSHEDSILAKNNVSKAPDIDMKQLRNDAILMDNWNNVLEQLKKSSIALFSAFNNSTAYISGDFVLVDTDNNFAFTLLRESAKRNEMRSAIKTVTGKRYKLGPFRDINNKKQDNDPLSEFESLIKKSTDIKLNKGDT